MSANDRRRPDGQSGFTLLELLVALALTGIVMGSVYGLLSGGQNAFRREPALTERQQNIRVAMDRILTDAIGGGGFFDNQNGVGPVAGPAGATDYLWFTQPGTEDCPDVDLEDDPFTGESEQLDTEDPFPACYTDPMLMVIIYPNGMRVGWGHNIHRHGDRVNFPPGQQPEGVDPEPLNCNVDPVDGVCPTGHEEVPIRIGHGNFVKYQIALEGDTNGDDICGTAEMDCVPSLWRSANGGMNTTTASPTEPPGVGWQLVARGIDDLQVRYLTDANWAAQTWTDTPAGSGTVRKVEITLGARTLGEGLLQGATGTGGLNAMRGQLRATVMPRPAIVPMSQASPNPPTYQ